MKHDRKSPVPPIAPDPLAPLTALEQRERTVAEVTGERDELTAEIDVITGKVNALTVELQRAALDDLGQIEAQITALKNRRGVALRKRDEAETRRMKALEDVAAVEQAIVEIARLYASAAASLPSVIHDADRRIAQEIKMGEASKSQARAAHDGWRRQLLSLAPLDRLAAIAPRRAIESDQKVAAAIAALARETEAPVAVPA